MANMGESGRDLYGVLGLHKECSASDLRNAYKKLALRWHPDRCSASGNSKHVQEANSKFQAIQQAYSVLSDVNKRFLYNVGAYNSDDDDDQDGMGDFLNEMAVMMTQTEPSTDESGEESFEQLQALFNDMFQGDIESSFGASFSMDASSSSSSSSTSSSAPYTSYFQCSNSPRGSNKVGKNGMNDSVEQASHFQNFSLGVENRKDFKKGTVAKGGGIQRGLDGRRRKQGRKQNASFGHVSVQ